MALPREGASLSMRRVNLCITLRRPRPVGRRPPLGSSKVSVYGHPNSHVLSIVADRDIVSCGSPVLYTLFPLIGIWAKRGKSWRYGIEAGGFSCGIKGPRGARSRRLPGTRGGMNQGPTRDDSSDVTGFDSRRRGQQLCFDI